MLAIQPKCSKALLALVVALALTAGLKLPIKAESPVSGITVAPAFVTINLNAADDTQIAYVGVKNTFSQPVDLWAELKGVDQESGILAPVSDLSPSLAQLISFTPANFTLAPNESINIQISVKNGSELGPGGNYAALVIKQAGMGLNNVSLQSAISANIFIIKEQGAKRQIDVLAVKLHRSFFEMPRAATVTFANSGNVIAVPRGLITVSDKDLNTVYKKGIINEGSLSVFPGKQLDLNIPLSTLAKDWLPGRQTVTMQYRVEGDSQVQTYQTTIIYIPTFYLLALVAVALGTWLFLRYRHKHKAKVAKNPVKHLRPTVKPKRIRITQKITVSGNSETQTITLRRSK